MVAKVGKASDLEKYIKDNTDFPNWKYAQQCIKYNYEYPLKCPVCGNFLALNKGSSGFLKTCGRKECTKEAIKKYNLKTYGGRVDYTI